MSRVSCGKTAEVTEMPMFGQTRLGTENLVLDGVGPDLHGNGQF